jgi:hypothetical protein
MSGWFGRFIRIAGPAAVLTLWGVLQTQPYVIGVLPVIAALGKYLRDKYTTAKWLAYLPF